MLRESIPENGLSITSLTLEIVVIYLNERLCGQMGVTMTAGTLGWIMLAPAATA